MLRKILLLCLLAALFSPVLLLSQLIDADPLVLPNRTPDIADAQKTKILLKSSWEVLKQDRHTQLVVKVDDLNAAIAFIGRGASYLSGNFTLQQQRLDGSLSVKIPKNPFGEYLNLSVQILPSEQGIALESCRIGNLKIPGQLALLVLQQGLNLLAEEQLGSQLLETVEKVSFSQDRIYLNFKSGTRFAELKNRLLARLKEFRTDQSADHELEKIQFYLQHLDNLNNFRTKGAVSLDRIMVPLFTEVRQQSLNGAAIKENQAALYALSIYLGGREFRKLADYLLSPEKKFIRNQRTPFSLGERRDLLKHFLVSVGIKQLSDAQMGFAVGEFKELLDANKGGSGFSFIDLAADRSGLRLAESATRSSSRAKRFQEIMVGIQTEKELFPNFRDLEEGLNQKHFIDRYGNIDSQRYKEIIALIDQRLAALPLYQYE